MNQPRPELPPTEPFTQDELRRTIEVLEAIVRDRALLSTIDTPDRVALMQAAGRVSRPTRHEQVRAKKAFRKIERHQTKAMDRSARAATEIRTSRLAPVFVAPLQIGPGEARASQEAEERELRQPRNCYVCKAEYRRLHFFYDAMCPDCSELNYAKRFQTAKLQGKTALITGARLKIGFQASLMMLRAGARVIVTTRFAHDAATRYARVADYDAWASRLSVHGLDLRHAPSVEIFARYLLHTEPRLDILINNAAQTVRRPPGFYAHLLEREAMAHAALGDKERPLLAAYEACKAALSGSALLPARAGVESNMALASFQGAAPGVGIRSPALMSQIPCTFDDSARGVDVFPPGETDADLQQIDLRPVNSWRLTLADVPTPEMLEVQLVNAVAPFILCSKLKPLMMREATFDKHIVNVSAMEGSFSRHTKTDKHPHTNMAKAALNMMTLTSAPDYAQAGIFMNAVDTGWVTDEDPAAFVTRKQSVHDFQPPLDIVDGAARVCDPFFSGLNNGVHVWGKFLKDYRATPW